VGQNAVSNLNFVPNNQIVSKSRDIIHSQGNVIEILSRKKFFAFKHLQQELQFTPIIYHANVEIQDLILKLLILCFVCRGGYMYQVYSVVQVGQWSCLEQKPWAVPL
jgi:hypothetical protein